MVKADGEYFLVMEFLDGGTLADRFKDSPIASGLFKEIALQLCDAVDYMHRQGVIHRDIKPENVMFSTGDSSARVKLCDFGLSKDKRDRGLSRFSFVAGTDDYASPQQLTDARFADERDDIYSIGKTFYAMLTGAICAGIDDYQEISELNGDAPEGIDKIVQKCIKHKKEDRFQNIRDLRLEILKLAIL